ncbi:MAG: cell division protein FtsZ [Pseudomonadota bacterium]
MPIQLEAPDIHELKPKIVVFGCGGAGGNAVNNMIESGLEGVDFIVANTDAQALANSKAGRVIQMGVAVTEGLGAGAQPEIGRAAAEEVIDEITDHLNGAHMAFITAGMGGGTGTGAAPVVARLARELGILTVGVVTKPFHFEGQQRMRIADAGIEDLQNEVDTLICIPNQNLFRIANDQTTFADAFAMADQVLFSGVACITDLMVKEGLINLDFADVRSIMRGMGKAMMGTGEASGDKRALQAAEAAIANPLLDDVSMMGAKGLLISITGGKDMRLFEVDEAATRIREEVDHDALIILGATFDETLEGMIRVSVVATGVDLAETSVHADGETVDVSRRDRSKAEMPEDGADSAIADAQAARQEAEAIARAAEAAMAAASAVEASSVDPKQAAEARIEQIERQLKLPEQDIEEDPPEADPHVTITAASPLAAQHNSIELDVSELIEDRPEPGVVPAPPKMARTSVAQAPSGRQPRMPRVDELPPIVRDEIRHKASLDAVGDSDRGALGLLKKLANVGLPKRDEPNAAKQPTATPNADRQPTPRAATAAPTQDGLGRPAPASSPSDDDAMDIPAFLRRRSG